MFRPRIIPCLLLKNKGLVKTVRFKDSVYIGDPINAVRIFNDAETDELIFLDIAASKEKRKPPYDLIRKIADEAYMPFAVGGGITDIQDIRELLSLGTEKVVINTTSVTNPTLINQAASIFGNQSIIASIDVKKNLFRKYEVFIYGGTKNTGLDPVSHAKHMEAMGAGEIFINSIDHDGVMNGFDIEIIKKISNAVNIPVIACGGAGKLDDLHEAVMTGGASALAAGSLFVFYGARKGVLINYPAKIELMEVFAY